LAIILKWPYIGYCCFVDHDIGFWNSKKHSNSIPIWMQKKYEIEMGEGQKDRTGQGGERGEGSSHLATILLLIVELGGGEWPAPAATLEWKLEDHQLQCFGDGTLGGGVVPCIGVLPPSPTEGYPPRW
jgi:hypothetical protein